MRDFMAKTDMVHQKLELLMRNNEQIKEYTSMYASQTLTAEANRISANVEQNIHQNEEIHKQIKELLDKVKIDITEEEKLESDKPEEERQEPPELRMKKQISSTLVVHFQDVLRETNKVQSDFKKAMQDNIKSQLRIVNPKLSEEELEQHVLDPEQGKKFLSLQMLGVHEKVKSTIMDIEDKYKDRKSVV